MDELVNTIGLSGRYNMHAIMKVAKTTSEAVLILDPNIVKANYLTMLSNMPSTDIYFAVKACPNTEIISLLHSLGCYFDVASMQEIKMLANLGIKASRMSYGNTIKHSDSIAYAYNYGIRLFTTDSIEDIRKLAVHAPGSDIIHRILVQNEGSRYRLDKKFGSSEEVAIQNIIWAKELGLNPVGISFHVGSQQTKPSAWNAALMSVKELFDDLEKQGISLSVVNIGGGLPAQYTEHIPDMDVYYSSIRRYIHHIFGESNTPIRIISEPGRSLTGDAGAVAVRVIMQTQKDPNDLHRWTYINSGLFHGFAEAIEDQMRYPIFAPEYNSTNPEFLVESIVAGQTCDSYDKLSQKTPYLLPGHLKEDDILIILTCGAYTEAYSSSKFNGFPAMQTHVLPLGD